MVGPPNLSNNTTSTGTLHITTLSSLAAEIQHLILDDLIHICPSKCLLLSSRLHIRTLQTHWCSVTVTSFNCRSLLSSRQPTGGLSSRAPPSTSSPTLHRLSSPGARLSRRFASVKHLSLGCPGDDGTQLRDNLCRTLDNKELLYAPYFPYILTLHLPYSQYEPSCPESYGSNSALVGKFANRVLRMISSSCLYVWDVRLRIGDGEYDAAREETMWWMMSLFLGAYAQRDRGGPFEEITFHIYPPAYSPICGEDEDPPEPWCKVEWRVEGEANHELDERVLKAWTHMVLREGGAGEDCSPERLEEVVDRSIEDLPGIAETLLLGRRVKQCRPAERYKLRRVRTP
ncbi:hypothetical protein IAT38_000498 [Cryptococcus sp. DSM 104549]